MKVCPGAVPAEALGRRSGHTLLTRAESLLALHKSVEARLEAMPPTP